MGKKKGGKKRMCAFVLGMLLFGGVAYAAPHITVAPDEVGTDYNTQRQEFGYGVGADVTVYKGGSNYLTEVTVEPRYDIGLRETRVFTVAHVDLWDIVKGEK